MAAQVFTSVNARSATEGVQKIVIGVMALAEKMLDALNAVGVEK